MESPYASRLPFGGFPPGCAGGFLGLLGAGGRTDFDGSSFRYSETYSVLTWTGMADVLNPDLDRHGEGALRPTPAFRA